MVEATGAHRKAQEEAIHNIYCFLLNQNKWISAIEFCPNLFGTTLVEHSSGESLSCHIVPRLKFQWGSTLLDFSSHSTHIWFKQMPIYRKSFKFWCFWLWNGTLLLLSCSHLVFIYLGTIVNEALSYLNKDEGHIFWGLTVQMPTVQIVRNSFWLLCLRRLLFYIFLWMFVNLIY